MERVFNSSVNDKNIYGTTMCKQILLWGYHLQIDKSRQALEILKFEWEYITHIWYQKISQAIKCYPIF